MLRCLILPHRVAMSSSRQIGLPSRRPTTICTYGRTGEFTSIASSSTKPSSFKMNGSDNTRGDLPMDGATSSEVDPSSDVGASREEEASEDNDSSSKRDTSSASASRGAVCTTTADGPVAPGAVLSGPVAFPAGPSSPVASTAGPIDNDVSGHGVAGADVSRPEPSPAVRSRLIATTDSASGPPAASWQDGPTDVARKVLLWADWVAFRRAAVLCFFLFALPSFV